MTEGAGRARKHRATMKVERLKPVMVEVPNVNSPEFKEELVRAIEIINNSAEEKIILEELSNIEIEGWK
jgi:hypothetical protein